MTAGAGGQPTVGIVVIGSEILSGKTEERNAAFMISRFRELGVRVGRVAIIPDDRADIAVTVRDFAARFDHVCTSGGIGPTHDDLTIESIARAFDVPVIHHPGLMERLERAFGDRLSAGHRRLARVPEGADLVGEGGSAEVWPTVRLRNVLVFPGIPQLMRAKFREVEGLFAGRRAAVATLHLAALESDVVEALDAVVGDHPEVEIGSYPRYEDERWRLRVTIESVSPSAVTRATDALAAALAEFVIEREDPASDPAP